MENEEVRLYRVKCHKCRMLFDQIKPSSCMCIACCKLKKEENKRTYAQKFILKKERKKSKITANQIASGFFKIKDSSSNQ